MQIIIDNSFSRVVGFNTQQYQQLRTLLSYKIATAESFYGGGRSPIRYLLSKKGEFMTGLVPRVIQYCTEQKIPHTVVDKRKAPLPTAELFKLQGFDPRLYQKQAVTALTCKSRGGAEMVTGSGKSLTMALLIYALQLKTLVVVPNLILREQLRETFLEVFGSLDNITVENIDSPKLKTPGDYDVLLIDETHHAAASRYRKLNKGPWRNIYHRYFFSGTFFRSQDEEGLLLEGIAGKPRFKFTYKDAVVAGAIVPIEAYYYSVPKQQMRGNESNYASVYSELVVNNQPRNLLIATLLGRIHQSGAQTLCLVKEIKHGQILSDMTFFPFANGEDGQSRDLIRAFNTGEIKTLIATTGVCAEGVDTRPAEYILMAAGGKAKTQFMQMVGRILRRYEGKETGKVIMFKDPSHKYLVKHFNATARYLVEEYGVKPTQLTLE